MEKLIGLYLREQITGIVDILLRPDRLTSVREADTSLQIDYGTKHEITMYDGFVEVAGVAQFFLQTNRALNS